MFEQLPAADHVMAMRLSGKLTGDDIKQYKGILEDKLGRHEHMGVCVDLTGLSDMNADALVEGTKADVELLAHLGRFSRCALISDKEWPHAVVRFMDPMLPGFEMKVFPPGRSDEAMTWAAERPQAPQTETSAFRFLPTSKDDVFAFEIDGVISSEEMPGVIKEFEAFLGRHDKVRLLNRMKHFAGIDPSVFMQSGLFSMKFAAMGKVERYAVVGAPAWMRKIVENVNPAFAGMEIRTFSADQEDDAWAWLGAKPSE